MKKAMLVVIVFVLFFWQAGCIIYSLHPWLGNGSKVAEMLLEGIWFDDEQNLTAFFTGEAKPDYNVLVIGAEKDQSKLSASLHRLDQTLLLMVGPEDPKNMPVAVLPGYMLLKAELKGDSLKLFDINLKSFAEKVDHASIQVVENGDRDIDYILASSTSEIENFIRAQLPEPGFFNDKPVYSFKRISRKN